MARLIVRNREIQCGDGENLRELLVRHEIIPAGNKPFGLCKGTTACNTCKVKISGTIAESSGAKERTVRLVKNETALSCKIQVMGELVIH
jgi:ferredoxin